jgi:hypothetical protein
MITLKITATGEIKSNKIRLEIINGPPITWGINPWTWSQRFEPRDGTGA